VAGVDRVGEARDVVRQDAIGVEMRDQLADEAETTLRAATRAERCPSWP